MGLFISFSDKLASELYHEWLSQYDPDSNIADYESSTYMADRLSDTIIKPFRNELIRRIGTLNLNCHMSHIAYLYDCMTNMDYSDSYVYLLLLKLYIIAMEEHDMPFYAMLRIVDWDGTCTIT